VLIVSLGFTKLGFNKHIWDIDISVVPEALEVVASKTSRTHTYDMTVQLADRISLRLEHYVYKNFGKAISVPLTIRR
jgi:hypothetical protein